MFTDPITIGEGEGEVELALTSVDGPSSHYVSSDGVYEIVISHTPYGDDSTQHEITLIKSELKEGTDIFSDGPNSLENGFSFSFITNSVRFESTTVIPILQTLLEAFVTESIRNRLISGEI